MGVQGQPATQLGDRTQPLKAPAARTGPALAPWSKHGWREREVLGSFTAASFTGGPEQKLPSSQYILGTVQKARRILWSSQAKVAATAFFGLR